MSFLIYMKQALSNLFKPPVTTDYPIKPKEFKPHDRGRVINDASKCILCGMCEKTCPAGAITVDRKNGTWKINPFSCVQCAGCVENCPKKCLHMDPHATDPDVEKSEIILQVKETSTAAKGKRTVAAVNMAQASMDDRSHIVNNILKCIFCGQCQRNCPAGAITVDRANRTWRINLDACINCGTCIDNCPRKCLSLGCYLGNRTDILMHAPKPVHRKAKPSVPKAPSPIPTYKTEEPSLVLNDRHVRIDASNCLFCGTCAENCPVSAITVDAENKTWTIDREKCVTCGVCVDNCPASCLTMAETYEEGERKEARPTFKGIILTEKPEHRPPAPAPETPKAEPTVPAPEEIKTTPQQEENPDLNDMHVKIAPEKCLLCGKCAHNCPMEAITIDRKTRTWTIDREKCVTCGVCVDGCPAHCLSMEDEYGADEKKVSPASFTIPKPQRPARPRPASKPAASPKAEAPKVETPKVETPKAEPIIPAPIPSPGISESKPDEDKELATNPWHVKNAIEKCILCGKCEHGCPMHAISIDRKNRTWTIDREKCVTCGICVDNCPVKALTMEEEFGENEPKDLVLTLQGKKLNRPNRPSRPAPAPKPAPKAEEPKPEPVISNEDKELATNPYHVRNAIEKCVLCGKCEHGCPMHAISIDRKNKTWTIDREKCVTCGICVDNCPVKALTMEEEFGEGEPKDLVLTLQKPPRKLHA
ncbi:4Fe-4S binding protein [Dialister sp.]|uniref:4Fe-4S binding protein n=1 Tax=Dialister sp. TaxID=1955814 RepID=UPI002E82363D|nr:4Fe-4S binding protein [Dialister sp.]MEE3453134.1 4Fe-4S binding protein [Dialister sp.]